MRRFLAFLLPCALVVVAGCAAEPEIPYRDQRAVTTRPTAGEKRADVVVRVRHVRLAPNTLPGDDAIPSDSTVLDEAETLATFGTSFYCTVRSGEQRIELGGIVTRMPNGMLRADVHYHVGTRGGTLGLKTTHDLHMGDTINFGGFTAGNSALYLTVEPLAK